MTKHNLLVLGAFTVLSFTLLSSNYGLRAQAQNASTPSGKKKGVVRIESETGKEETTAQGIIRTLDGKVIIKKDDTTLTTEKAIYNDTTGVATSPGKIVLNDPYNTLTATTGKAYYKTRDAQFRGNVVIVARPRPEDANAPKGSSRRKLDAPATITSEKVDYNWRTRVAQIFDGLTIKQKDMTIVAQRGTYDARTETAILEGNPVKYTKPNGDWATAPRVVADLKNEVYQAVKGVKAVIEIEEEEGTDTSGTSSNPASPATRPGTRPGVNPNGPTPKPTAPPTTPPTEAPPTAPPTNPETPPANGGGETP